MLSATKNGITAQMHLFDLSSDSSWAWL